MRNGDVQKLTTALYELLKEFHLRDEGIVNTCLSLIGLYIGKFCFLAIIIAIDFCVTFITVKLIIYLP